jgi:pSer/pThr/pTyr-binding forkhead associated (FHA) protein
VSAPLTPSVGSTPLATKSYTLILLSKDGRELTRFALREGVNQVGVKSVGEGIFPDVDLSSVDNDQVVSRRHAILRVSRDHVTIADCGSTNGTYVDGTKIGSSEVPLNDQNIIKFANIFAKIIQS